MSGITSLWNHDVVVLKNESMLCLFDRMYCGLINLPSYMLCRLASCLCCQFAVDPHQFQIACHSQHTKDTVEFDRVDRMITLRQYTQPAFSCGDTLIREQRLPLDSIDSFKCALSSKIGRKHIFGNGVDRHHAVLLAVKRSLHHDDLDDWLLQPGHAALAYCPMLGQSCESSPVQSSTAGPPYAWPAFIERSIFTNGDLLFLNFHYNPRNTVNVMLPRSQYFKLVYADHSGYVCEEHSHVQAIVQQLNLRLAVARSKQ
jgi:hypothetical protein